MAASRESKNPPTHLESAILGAWIASILMFWIASLSHRTHPEFALDLDSALRSRLAAVESSLGALLVVLVLRRGVHGLKLLLPFLALALALIAALWLAPDAATLEHSLLDVRKLASAESASRLGRIRTLRRVLFSVDAGRVIALAGQLLIDATRRGGRR